MNIEEIKARCPNLWRVTLELSKFKNPHTVCGMLLDLAGPILVESSLPQKEQKGAGAE